MNSAHQHQIYTISDKTPSSTPPTLELSSEDNDDDVATLRQDIEENTEPEHMTGTKNQKYYTSLH